MAVGNWSLVPILHTSIICSFDSTISLHKFSVISLSLTTLVYKLFLSSKQIVQTMVRMHSGDSFGSLKLWKQGILTDLQRCLRTVTSYGHGIGPTSMWFLGSGDLSAQWWLYCREKKACLTHTGHHPMLLELLLQLVEMHCGGVQLQVTHWQDQQDWYYIAWTCLTLPTFAQTCDV